jgi:hypothetical protein
LEIFDKLACSLGQDVMDGLYRTTRDHLQLGQAPPRSPAGSATVQASSSPLLRLCFHFIVAVLYVVGHALILFVQIVCLNVAINSRNNALFTLLISNNFMELKASVFKRFEAENLFQVACSDAVERFQLGLFLVLIGVQELTSLSAVTTLLPPMLAIFACEVRQHTLPALAGSSAQCFCKPFTVPFPFPPLSSSPPPFFSLSLSLSRSWWTM